MFENDVKEYGTQTSAINQLGKIPFENDVKEYGTQTNAQEIQGQRGLRMM